MNKGSNSKKRRFIESFPSIALEDEQCDIAERCKFCFSYFDSTQKHSGNLETWDERNLQELVKKLKEYSRHSLEHWKHERIGSHRNHVLEIYGSFPRRSNFQHPQHVPYDVDWARFRLDGRKRLIGFTIPKQLCKAGSKFDDNTFYVVFLDPEHNFYLGKR